MSAKEISFTGLGSVTIYSGYTRDTIYDVRCTIYDVRCAISDLEK